MNWVNTVLTYTEDAESPERYYYWSSLCAISSVVSPNIFLDRFYYKLTPNIYVFLVGESGIRKGPPIKLAADLVQEVDCTRVIKGRFTIQGIIKILGKAVTLQGGNLLTDSRAFIACGEFASSLIYDPQGIVTLTDLYDRQYHEDWDNTLSTVPINKLIKPCITFLAATNETNLEKALPEEATTGGFVARISIIHETKRKKLNSLMYAPRNHISIKDLAVHLKELAKLNGEVTLDENAKKEFDSWYNAFNIQNFGDKTGTINRIGDTILKVAILIHFSNSVDLIVSKTDIEEAIDRCMETISGMRRVTISSGKSELAYKTKLVLTDLIKRFPESVKRSQLLRNHWGDLDGIDLDRIIDNLDQSCAIQIERVPKDFMYKVRQEVYEQYIKFSDRKGKSNLVQ